MKNITITRIKSQKWEKLGDWSEIWFHTELCFKALHFNPLTKDFITNKMNCLALNQGWYYEKSKMDIWAKDQISLSEKDLFFL